MNAIFVWQFRIEYNQYFYRDLRYIIDSQSGMLKNLKKGKQDKKQAKKQTNKQKTSKNDNKKPKEQEEEQTNTELVDINYNQKQTTVKTVKKVQASKLEEKQIDTSNIVIEKKQQKKVVTSWIVNEAQIKNLLRKDFNAAEHETDFVSLTDDTINKQLEEKAKKDALENKPKIVEMGGIKMAPLQNTEKGKEQDFVFSKRPETTGIITNLPVKEIVFVNSNQGGSLNFAPLQKTPQQLKQEELEARAKKEPEVAVKGKANGWLGVKANETKPPQEEFKVSAWALLAQQNTNEPMSNFAPLQKTAQEMKLLEGGSRRQEQQFKFTSKKEVEERRRKRQMEEAALKEAALKKI